MTASGHRRALVRVAACAAIASFTLALTSDPAQVQAAGDKRLALIIGNDVGGRDTRPLYFAARDAQRIHTVLTELGSVRMEDAILLLNRSASDIYRALGDLEQRTRRAQKQGQRVALVVYYSGHAKDGDLQLGDTRVPLEDLKHRLQHSAAEVKLGIFDSCRSGEMRTKGVRRTPAFDVQSNASQDARGTVFLSSSSADEDAQESDEIGGSYFSRHLEDGLRGGADRSHDDRVTLSEAYAYAYARTLADTAASAAGAQHPTFSYDLKGNGDLVLTEIGGREALRVPAQAPAGVYYLVRQGVVAAEVLKAVGEPRTIALRPGRYHVKRRLANRLRVGQVQIAAGQVTMLDESQLRDAPFSDDPVKGVNREMRSRWSLGVTAGYQAFFDEPTRDNLFPPTGLIGAELQVRDFFRRGWVAGMDFAVGSTQATLNRFGDVALPFTFSEVVIGGSLFTEWTFFDGRLIPFLGGRVAFVFLTRTFEPTDRRTAFPSQFFSTFSPGLIAGLQYRFSADVSGVARTRVHYLLYNIDENRSLGYWELATALSYEF